MKLVSQNAVQAGIGDSNRLPITEDILKTPFTEFMNQGKTYLLEIELKDLVNNRFLNQFLRLNWRHFAHQFPCTRHLIQEIETEKLPMNCAHKLLEYLHSSEDEILIKDFVHNLIETYRFSQTLE